MPEQWILDLTEELRLSHTSPDQEQFAKSIYRVPKILTDINPQAYEPMLASFGPYHHGRPHLRYMEQHKRRALNQFLRRIKRASKTLEDVVNDMREVQSRLFASYESLDIEDYDKDCCEQGRFQLYDWRNNKDDFLKLMIIDGCFALEVMRTEVSCPNFSNYMDSENDSDSNSDVDYSAYESDESDSHDEEDDAPYKGYRYCSHDPVFGTKKKNYFVPYLANDMLLLENQLPLLALTILANIDGLEVEDVGTLITSFYGLFLINDKKASWWQLCFSQLFSFFRVKAKKKDSEAPTELSNHSEEDAEAPAELSNHSEVPTKQSSHILDLYREIRTSKGKYRLTDEDKHSATELRNAGVSFRKSESNSFRDITFKGGVLSIPRLEIDGSTESVLLNLIAFEQLHQPANNNVTAYAVFMDKLIDTVDDVALLKSKNIIQGIRGSDKDIADMFNKITKGATHVYVRVGKKDENVNEDLDRYCKKRINRWKASFMELYLKNPWVFISLIGGLLLLALTVLQTAYTIRQYYNA